MIDGVSQTAPVLLATSIAPGPRLSLQQEAVASWLTLGVRVVSLNAAEEIAALAAQFPDIHFVPVERTGKLMTGKPLVFVSDILRHLADTTAPVVGIVNSDVRVEQVPALASFLSTQAAETLLCCPRLDVPAWDAPDGRIDPFGFDLFVFPAAIIPLWHETRLCLGQGFWDHWLPLAAILAGVRPRKILPPLVRHIPHETTRDDSFFIFADEFATLATGYMVDSPDGAPQDWSRFGHGFPKHAYAELRRKAEAGRPADLEAYARHLDALSRYVVKFIDANCEHVAPPR